MNPWDRQRDPETEELEPMLWFGRFSNLYLPMSTERTLLGAVKAHKSPQQTNSVPGAWKDAFERWDWKKRAEAWDIAELGRRTDEFRADCDEWRQERFKDARALRRKARELLALPVIRQTAEKLNGKGEPIMYLVAAVPPSTLRSAAGILKTADELARITTRETLPKIEIEQDNLNVDFSTLSREQLKRISAGESVRDVIASSG